MSAGDGSEGGQGPEEGELPPLPSGRSREELLRTARDLVVVADTSNSTGMPDPHKHGRMTPTEALGVVTAIGKYYPYWLTDLPEEAVESTMRAWAGELMGLGEFDEVWEEVADFLRREGGRFPPAIFQIRRAVADSLYWKRMVYRSPPKVARTPEEEAFSELQRDDHMILIMETLEGKHRKALKKEG